MNKYDSRLYKKTMLYNKNFFIIFYFFIIGIISYGAENKGLAHLYKIEKIDADANTKHVTHITNNIIAITNNNQLHILQLNPVQKIHSIKIVDEELLSHSIFHTHDNKIIAASRNKILIYDLETKKQQLEEQFLNQFITATTIHPRKSILFVLSSINGFVTKYNYVTKESESFDLPQETWTRMSIHPNKEIMCLASDRMLSFCPLENLNTIEAIGHTHKIVLFCNYSPDGSYIVTGDAYGISAIHLNKKSNELTILAKNERFLNIKFHPNGLLAIFTAQYSGPSESSIGRSLYFWDLKERKCVHVMPYLKINSEDDFSFSKNGLEVVIAGYKSIIKTYVPFVVQEYEKLFIWLKKLEQQHLISKDIIMHCLNIFLRR